MKNNNIKIVAIGDSITYGYPYEPALSWFNMAVTQLNIDYVNNGINGDTTDGMVARFDQHVLRYEPSHVIIMGGTNDAYAEITVDHVINNIRKMVEAAFQSNIIPLLGLPIPCNDLAEEQLLGQYREEMRQFADDSNIEVIDFHKGMVEKNGVNLKAGFHCDGLHPNEAGYKIMADIAAQILVQAFIDARVHDYYWNEDLSCTITTLKILSELLHFEIHPQVMEAAYGLNAGRLGSQCGLVEGMLLFIGVCAQQKAIDPKDIAELCHNFAIGFQSEFKSLLCKELRPQGFSSDNPPHLCEKLTKLAVAFSADFVASEILHRTRL